ncbi:unnamed protein product [Gordionus sp. m RMFG-2023]
MKSIKIRNRRRSLGQISGGLALLEAINNGKTHLAKFILGATTNIGNESSLILNKDNSLGANKIDTSKYGLVTPVLKSENVIVNNYNSGRRSTIVDAKDFQGKTALIRAIYLQDDKIRKKAIELLLKFGAKVNSCDNYGRSALSYSCQLQRNDIIKILVKHNVDPDLPDNLG